MDRRPPRRRHTGGGTPAPRLPDGGRAAGGAGMNTLQPSTRPLGLGVARRADGRVLAAAGVAALLTDLAVRSGVAAVSGTLLVVAVVGATLVSGRVANRQAAGVLV